MKVYPVTEAELRAIGSLRGGASALFSASTAITAFIANQLLLVFFGEKTLNEILAGGYVVIAGIVAVIFLGFAALSWRQTNGLIEIIDKETSFPDAE